MMPCSMDRLATAHTCEGEGEAAADSCIDTGGVGLGSALAGCLNGRVGCDGPKCKAVCGGDRHLRKAETLFCHPIHKSWSSLTLRDGRNLWGSQPVASSSAGTLCDRPCADKRQRLSSNADCTWPYDHKKAMSSSQSSPSGTDLRSHLPDLGP